MRLPFLWYFGLRIKLYLAGSHLLNQGEHFTLTVSTFEHSVKIETQKVTEQPTAVKNMLYSLGKTIQNIFNIINKYR